MPDNHAWVGWCPFCDRPKNRGQRRVPGVAGTLCVNCIQVGLRIVTGSAQAEDHGLIRLAAATDPACQFCRREQRRTFIGLHRRLERICRSRRGVVVCADCLDEAGNVVNDAVAARRPPH